MLNIFPFTLSVGWSLTRVDIDVDALDQFISAAGLGSYPTATLQGKYPPSDERIESGSDWTETQIPSRKPHPTFSADKFDRFSFTLHLAAETILDNIEPTIRQLMDWSKPDPEVGRPPVLRFQCGDFTFTGVFTSVSPALSDRWFDGRVKTAQVAISMSERQWPPPDSRVTSDPTKPPHLSRYVIAKDGDTFESLCRTEYGDPMMGVMLRQDNVMAFPAAGEVVYLPPKSYFANRGLTPDAVQLSEAEDNQQALRDLLDELDSQVYNPVD